MGNHFTNRGVPTDSGYPYTSLNTSTSFRLLRILHASTSPWDIHCTIEIYDRSSAQCPPYTALSYVWGSSTSRKPVQLNGRTAWVTTNLYDALLHLGYNVPNSMFWIDALCINQNNPTERGHQVAQMRAIYSGARRVVSWLGPMANPGEEVSRLFTSLERHHDTCGQSGFPRWSRPIPLDTGLINVLQYILHSSYWDRVWVVQEIVVATHLTLLCGNSMIDWHVFGIFIRMAFHGHVTGLGIKHQMDQLRLDGLPRVFKLLHWRRIGVSLVDALDWTSGCLATDPRDRVYAVLGLVDSGEHIDADYTISPCALVGKVIRILLQNSSDFQTALRLLIAVGTRKEKFGIVQVYQLKERRRAGQSQVNGDTSYPELIHIWCLIVDALKSSAPCRESEGLWSFLFSEYLPDTARESDVETKPLPTHLNQENTTIGGVHVNTDATCGGDHCALRYVLRRVVFLHRARARLSKYRVAGDDKPTVNIDRPTSNRIAASRAPPYIGWRNNLTRYHV